MKTFLIIVDSYSEDTKVERSLTLLGLKNSEDYVICNADRSSDQILKGDPGERLVDAEVLLVFISSFHGLSGPSVVLARKIKEANPAAKIHFYSTMPLSLDQSDNVFDSAMKKEFLTHPNLIALVRETFDI